MQLIFTGAKGSGKSTTAEHFIKHHDASHVYFAHGIDRELYEMLNIPWEVLRTKPYPEWLRKLKQWWGTELRRDMPAPVGDKNYWVDQWLSAVRARLTVDPDVLVVCDDLRYPNEHSAATALSNTFFIRCSPNPDYPVDEQTSHTSELHWKTMEAHLTVAWQPLEQRISEIEQFLVEGDWGSKFDFVHTLTPYR